MPAIYRNMRFDTVRDLTPIIQATSSAPMLAVHPSVSAKNLKEFITLAKAKPKFYNFGSAGTGSTAHLAAELFQQLTNSKFTHVPYKGDGPALADLLASLFLEGVLST